MKFLEAQYVGSCSISVFENPNYVGANFKKAMNHKWSVIRAFEFISCPTEQAGDTKPERGVPWGYVNEV